MGLMGLALAGPAAAQTTYLTTSTTINSAIRGGVYVGKDSNNQITNPVTMQPYDLIVQLVSGGTFGMPGGINFYDNTLGSFTFCGTGLTSSPGITNPVGGETAYVLAGTLQNSQSITGDTIEVFQGATMFSFTTSAAVPEVSTTVSFGLLLMLGLGGMAAAARKKKAAA